MKNEETYCYLSCREYMIDWEMRKTIAEINKYGKLEKLPLATLQAWQSYRCIFNLNIFGRTPLWLCKKECFIEAAVICYSYLYSYLYFKLKIRWLDNSASIYVRNLRFLVIEVFKSFHKLNPEIM